MCNSVHVSFGFCWFTSGWSSKDSKSHPKLFRKIHVSLGGAPIDSYNFLIFSIPWHVEDEEKEEDGEGEEEEEEEEEEKEEEEAALTLIY